ncbi:MAG: caspase family protein [Proteobacteria bacterium]|nr:caspase family protein [Pseudomonadota bacterium]MCG2831611.1 caspase family protein [Desulfobacteraceae bacterium]
MSAYRKILIVCFALFLSSCAWHTTPVLTVKNADMSREIKQRATAVSKVEISPDGRYVLSSGYDCFILWDILLGEKIQTYTQRGFLSYPTAVAFSPDGKYFASGGKGIKLWDLATRQEIMTFDGSKGYSINFSPDGKHFIFCGPPSDLLNPFSTKKPTMKIFDVATGGEIRDFKLQGIPWSVVYSPDGKYVLSGSGNMTLWNTSLGKPIKTVAGSIEAVAFSSDGEYALSGGVDGGVRLWNAKNLTQIKKFVGHTASRITSVAFSPDGKYVLSGGDDGNIKIWELASGTEWKVLAGHTGMYGASAKFFPNGKYVISAGDASTRIWDVSTGEEVASMIAFEDGEWIITTANGYYNSSPKGDQYLSVKIKGKDYTVEQLRESFYRPDLVNLALSGGSLKELKNVANVKPPPVVAIVDTPKSIDKSDAAITLKITDAGGGIGDIRLYLNGSAVMLDSTRGVKIVTANQNEIYKTYKLKLSSGLNSIRAIAFNADNTMQSTDAIYEITASFKSIGRPSLYALVIGINEYKNPKLQLNYAIADATLFADTLKKGASALFDKVEVKNLSSKEETTRENIMKELKAMQSLNPDDLFVLYVASHGTVDDGEYFLITSNVGSTRTERLKTDAIGQSVFKELIGNIPATKKLIIIDTCNAGALGEAIQVAMLTRGMSEDTAMKILSRAVGSTILSASTSLQEALEGYQGHGLFTYVLAEGLKGKADKGNTGYVRTTELADYVDTEVPVLAEKIFKKAQYPTISISGQAFPIGKVR